MLQNETRQKRSPKRKFVGKQIDSQYKRVRYSLVKKIENPQIFLKKEFWF